jgi:GNAT superfamily N-acetyltransferase
VIRTPRPNEATAIAQLWHDAWHDAHGPIAPPTLVAARTLETFLARLPPLLPRLLVFGDAAPRGFVAWTPDGELAQCFVAREARGNGVGAALLRAGEHALRAQGTDTAHLACAFRNEPARRFYMHHGWHDPGISPRVLPYYAGAFASVLIHRMTKRLG